MYMYLGILVVLWVKKVLFENELNVLNVKEINLNNILEHKNLTTQPNIEFNEFLIYKIYEM